MSPVPVRCRGRSPEVTTEPGRFRNVGQLFCSGSARRTARRDDLLSVLRPTVSGVREGDDITELDVDILRAVATGRLPGGGLLTLELRRLEALGLIDITRGAARLRPRGTHAIEVANGECAAG